MIKQYLFGTVALLLATLLLLSGCGTVSDALDEHFPEASVTDEEEPINDPLPERVGRTYVILLTTQLESDDALSTVSLLTFQTADDSIHWLELPAALYVRAAGNTLGGSFTRAYQSELAKESGTTVSATQAGIYTVRDLLNTGFSISVDYSINFDRQQFTAFMQSLQNVPVTLPKSMGGLAEGQHTLDASKAIDFLLYAKYSDPAEGQFEARRHFVASLRQQACKVIDLDQLSLVAMDLRGEMTTDIPSVGGQDMFFLRRFLKTENDDFAITNISTQNVYYGGAESRVLIKDNTRRQLNQQMRIYEDELALEQFDPSGVFVDPANQIMQTVYASSTGLPTVYTLTVLLGLEEDIDTDVPPVSSEDRPDSSDAPAEIEEADPPAQA